MFEEGEPSMERISQHKMENPKIVINVGGVKHEVMWAGLEKRPLTRLGMLGGVQLVFIKISKVNLDPNLTITNNLNFTSYCNISTREP